MTAVVTDRSRQLTSFQQRFKRNGEFYQFLFKYDPEVAQVRHLLMNVIALMYVLEHY
jgi:hypothetical protein